MPAIDDEKEQITRALSGQYAHNSISLEEYERLIESVQKIGTARELRTLQALAAEDGKQKHLSLFSWRSAAIHPLHGNAGTYASVLGATRITIGEQDLPKGRTLLTVHSILGLTEIHVPKRIKIINKTTPFLAGVFMPDETGESGIPGDPEPPELYILGRAILGNITIIRT